MLSAYVNEPDMEGAEKFFKRTKQDGFEPGVVTYGTIIKGYAKVNNLEKMMQKYEEMRVSGIKPNQTIFTTIMDAYGRNQDFGTAVVWYKEMESCGLPPDQKSKNILLSLAKTQEEQLEAQLLVGYDNHQTPVDNIFDDDDDGDDDDAPVNDFDDDDDNDDDGVEQTILFVERDDKFFVYGEEQNEGVLNSINT